MSGDIDIDVRTDFKSVFDWTRASMVLNGELVKHPCGYYPQNIPVDPVTGFSAIPFKQAEENNYMKIDFLHNNVYNLFSSRKEIDNYLKKEPNWNLLLLKSNHSKLFQLSNHGELLVSLRPASIDDLADVLALIRPGKQYLIPIYQKMKKECRILLWKKNSPKDGEEEYNFKKSHAYAYALVIILQLHLIEEGRL